MKFMLNIFAYSNISDLIAYGTFVATSALAIIAYFQLNQLNKQTKADFLLKFNHEFFKDEINRRIIKSIEEEEPILLTNKGKNDEYDLDDYLGYFNLMKNYWDKKLIDFDLLYGNFGHYVARAWENGEIREYVFNLRKERKDDGYYKSFEELANEIIKREEIDKK